MAVMKAPLMVVTTVGVVILFLSACAAVPPSAPRPREEAHQIERPANQYFFYLEALAQVKRGRPEQAIALLNRALEMDPASLVLKRELAGLYLRQKDYANALGVVEAILAQQPDEIEFLVVLGKIREQLEEVQPAIEAYEQVLIRDPTRQDIYLSLGSLYMGQNDLKNAHRVYSQLIREVPEAYAGHFFLGQIYARQGLVERAEKAFRKTLAMEPDLEEPRFELIEIYRSQGRRDKVLKTYREILARNPGNVRASLELAEFYRAGGQTAAADTLLAELGQRSLEDNEVIRQLVTLYFDSENYQSAATTVEAMLPAAPQSADLHYLAGVARDGLGDKDAAREHFLKVPPDSRFYQNAAVHVAFYYQEADQLERGIAHLQGAIANAPENPDFRLYLGSFYEELEEYAKAEGVLKEGLALAPRDARLHFRLGVVYDKWNRKEDSIASMRTVLALEPENAAALNYLGYTFADLGRNLDEAERLVQAAMKHKPDDGYITDSLGWVYYKKGQYDKAVHYLLEAVRLVPDDPVILEHLGDAYRKLNDRPNALKYYRRALEKTDSDTADLEEKIRSLGGDVTP
jgi:tetratricopeptide (TPR) repeat protein